MSLKHLRRRLVEHRVTKEVEKELGNASLGTLARVMDRMIRVVGPIEVRSRVIKWIEGDLKYAVEHSTDPKTTIAEQWALAKATPEYKELLDDVQITEDMVELMIEKALSGKEVA